MLLVLVALLGMHFLSQASPTSSWKMCTLSSASTYALYFDIVNAHNNPIPDSMIFTLHEITL